MRNAAAVTACSSFTLADAERRFGLEVGRGRVIPNGVDLTGKPSAGPDGSGVLPDGPYILALGRVVAKKGFDLLLEAFAALAGQFSTVGLVIAGAGTELETLRRRAVELGVSDRAHFVGRLDRDQVAAAMAGAEVFVMPSRLEPFGIVILEGWRAGTAVVATTRGGPPELVRDGQDGILVDPFDRRAFTEALERLLGDDRLRRSVADAGRARVVSFAWPEVADRYRDVYATVLGTDPGGERSGGRTRAAPPDDPARQGEAVA
jgi:glycogen(starch) synthase